MNIGGKKIEEGRRYVYPRHGTVFQKAAQKQIPPVFCYLKKNKKHKPKTRTSLTYLTVLTMQVRITGHYCHQLNQTSMFVV